MMWSSQMLSSKVVKKQKRTLIRSINEYSVLFVNLVPPLSGSSTPCCSEQALENCLKSLGVPREKRKKLLKDCCSATKASLTLKDILSPRMLKEATSLGLMEDELRYLEIRLVNASILQCLAIFRTVNL